MKALIVIDAQNEFSDKGGRTVPAHNEILARIQWHVQRAREGGDSIAWVQHYNKPDESPAFIPGSWGAELSQGLGPKGESRLEGLFQKDVFGAFFGTGLEEWLHAKKADEALARRDSSPICVCPPRRGKLWFVDFLSALTPQPQARMRLPIRCWAGRPQMKCGGRPFCNCQTWERRFSSSILALSSRHRHLTHWRNDGMQNSLSSRRAFLAGSASAALAGLSASAWSELQPVEGPNLLRIQKLAWAGVRLQLAESALFIDPLINRNVWESASGRSDDSG